jgi:hypothetical protein
MLKTIFSWGLLTASLCFLTPALAEDNAAPDPDDDSSAVQQLHDGERAQQLTDQEQKAIQQAQDQYTETQADLRGNQNSSGPAITLRAQVEQDRALLQQYMQNGKNLEAHEEAARLKRDEQLLKEAEKNEYRNDSNINEYHEPHEDIAPQQYTSNQNSPPPEEPSASQQDRTNLQKYQVPPNNDDSPTGNW